MNEGDGDDDGGSWLSSIWQKKKSVAFAELDPLDRSQARARTLSRSLSLPLLKSVGLIFETSSVCALAERCLACVCSSAERRAEFFKM